jgi:two-component sensor histidine kinase
VFRLGDLMSRLLSANDGDPLTVMDIALYDAPAPDPAALLFRSSELDDMAIEGRRFSHVQKLPLFGRVWTLQTTSKLAFEAEAYSSGPKVIAAAGILLSLLLTALAGGLAARARQSAANAAATEKANEQIRLLMHEVNHRSKNLLAVVRAIARQTATHSPKTFVQDFSKRIEALSASNDTLVHNRWRWVPLSDLVRSQLSHFGELLGDRINLSGPIVHLTPAAAQTIGMAVHELATNAGKHGALSTKAGTVDIVWSVKKSDTGEDRLRMSWVEQGGPKVTPPTSKGFGSVVLDAMARQGLSAEVDLTFDPGGVRWSLDCPLEMVHALSES